jgi:hypothetical protein
MSISENVLLVPFPKSRLLSGQRTNTSDVQQPDGSTSRRLCVSPAMSGLPLPQSLPTATGMPPPPVCHNRYAAKHGLIHALSRLMALLPAAATAHAPAMRPTIGHPPRTLPCP